MNTKTLVVLTILVALLGAYIFFIEKETLTTDERREEEKKVLVLEKDDVIAVEITWADTKVRLERHDPPEPEDEEKDDDEKGDIFLDPQPEWRLHEPLAARAAKSDVDSLLRTLTSLEKTRTLEDVSRSDVGLDEPRGKVTLTTDDGDTVLEIGPDLPASSDMVVAVGDAIYQVSNSVWTDLTKSPGDWRDKKLFTAMRQEIDRLTLTSGETQVLLAKRGDDFWVESPITDLADKNQVNGLLSSVTSLEAETFLDDAALLTDLGLDPPAHVLEVVLAGRQEVFRLEIGNTTGGGDAADVGGTTGDRYAADVGDTTGGSDTTYGPRAAMARYDGQIVQVKTRLLDSFAIAPEDWRSRVWTPLQVFRVDSARFEDAVGTVEVTRDEGDWRRGDDRVAYSAVSDVLYAIADAKAEEVLSREEVEKRGHRLEGPVLQINLSAEDSSQSLALYPSVEGFSAATREGRDAVLLLDSDTVDELTSKIQELRDAEPLEDESEDEDQDEASE